MVTFSTLTKESYTATFQLHKLGLWSEAVLFCFI